MKWISTRHETAAMIITGSRSLRHCASGHKHRIGFSFTSRALPEILYCVPNHELPIGVAGALLDAIEPRQIIAITDLRDDVTGFGSVPRQ